MTVQKVERLLREFANRPREIHVFFYGLFAIVAGPKIAEEISEEPQYLLVAVLVALGYKHYRD